MKVLLADSPKICSALRLLLEQEAGVEVVAEVFRTDDLLSGVGRTHPDLLLLGWELPGELSSGLLSALWALFPDLRVIALSGRPEVRPLALEAGVDAFVSKGDPPERLLAALRAVEAQIAGGGRHVQV
jgi:DNA-binding NarL/FixJ family response regulator